MSEPTMADTTTETTGHNRTVWQEWEKRCLTYHLQKAATGTEWQEAIDRVAQTTGRTSAAVESMIKRLQHGTAAYPEGETWRLPDPGAMKTRTRGGPSAPVLNEIRVAVSLIAGRMLAIEQAVAANGRGIDALGVALMKDLECRLLPTAGSCDEAEATEPAVLTWEGDGEGGLQAISCLHDDGLPFRYRITPEVHHGRFCFTLRRSDNELDVGPKPHLRPMAYTTVEAAKQACEANERQIQDDNAAAQTSAMASTTAEAEAAQTAAQGDGRQN